MLPALWTPSLSLMMMTTMRHDVLMTSHVLLGDAHCQAMPNNDAGQWLLHGQGLVTLVVTGTEVTGGDFKAEVWKSIWITW